MLLAYFGRRDRLRRKASRWVARLQRPMTNGERAEFLRWYRADPENASTFERVSGGFDVSILLEESELVHEAAAPATQGSPPYQYALAALLVAAICLSLLLLVQNRGREAQEGRFMLATEVGEVREFPLADGSRMTLDTDTAVAVDLGEDRRQVTLQRGRARIAVARAPEAFRLAVRSTRISTSGGVVDVALVDDRAVVAPIRGAVRILGRDDGPSGRDDATVSEGQRAVFGSNGVRIEARPLARGEALWPTGMLEFDATPLAEAVAQANRYSREQIRLGPDAATQHRVTGAFRAGDVAGLARSLAAAFDLSLERLPDGSYLLRARGR